MGTFISQAIEWIEAHEHTVELLKWLVVGLIAWAVGLFRVIRSWASRPSLAIEPAYSHCFRQVGPTTGEHADHVVLAFVVDVEVINPMDYPLAVQSFEVQLRRAGLFRRWTKPVRAIGFPSMPQSVMPDGNIKIVPLWFTLFEEFGDDLRRDRIDSHDAAAALTFFAIGVPATIAPGPEHMCQIRVTAKFVGGMAEATARIRVHSDFTRLERMVKNGASFASNPRIWKKTE